MQNNNYDLEKLDRYLPFPLRIKTVSRRQSNAFRHVNNRLEVVHLCFVLNEQEDEVLRLDGTARVDAGPPLMRITYPGMLAHHLKWSLRNELFFTYRTEYLEPFKSFGFQNCNFKLSPRFSSILEDIERLLPDFLRPGIADRLDRLAVMLASEAMLSTLNVEEGNKEHVNERIFQVEKYFLFHYTEKFDLPQILKKHGLTLRTFYREWSKFFKVSPAEYVQDLRMKEAKRLLTLSSLKIFEVAEMCGYSNEIYFSRVFTHHTGVTPTVFRKRQI